MNRLYIIYDQRAYTIDPDDCAVMCIADSLDEAREDVDLAFPGCPIYSYARTRPLTDEQLEE